MRSYRRISRNHTTGVWFIRFGDWRTILVSPGSGNDTDIARPHSNFLGEGHPPRSPESFHGLRPCDAERHQTPHNKKACLRPSGVRNAPDGACRRKIGCIAWYTNCTYPNALFPYFRSVCIVGISAIFKNEYGSQFEPRLVVVQQPPKLVHRRPSAGARGGVRCHGLTPVPRLTNQNRDGKAVLITPSAAQVRFVDALKSWLGVSVCCIR